LNRPDAPVARHDLERTPAHASSWSNVSKQQMSPSAAHVDAPTPGHVRGAAPSPSRSIATLTAAASICRSRRSFRSSIRPTSKVTSASSSGTGPGQALTFSSSARWRMRPARSRPSAATRSPSLIPSRRARRPSDAPAGGSSSVGRPRSPSPIWWTLLSLDRVRAPTDHRTAAADGSLKLCTIGGSARHPALRSSAPARRLARPRPRRVASRPRAARDSPRQPGPLAPRDCSSHEVVRHRVTSPQAVHVRWILE
jgi:hypothetical protein